jgi:hypothetical protein
MVSGSLRVALLLRYDQVARSSSKTEFYDQTLDPRRKSKIYDQARPPKPIYHNWVFLTLVSDYFFWIYIVALLNKVTILEVLVRQDQYCFGLCFVLDGPGSHHPSSKMWIVPCGWTPTTAQPDHSIALHTNKQGARGGLLQKMGKKNAAPQGRLRIFSLMEFTLLGQKPVKSSDTECLPAPRLPCPVVRR